MTNYFIIIIFINFLLLVYYKSISKYYNLFDYPDFKRKLHSKPIPILGGLYIQINLIIILIFNSFEINIFNNDNFTLKKEFYLFFFTFLFYILGFYDDKYSIKPNIKLILMSSMIFLLLYLDSSVLISTLSFSFFEEKIILGKYSYFLTVLCFLLFINAFNMLDGINGQATSYLIFIFIIFILKNILPLFFLALLICIILFLILNLKNKSYLGDSGTLSLSFLVSYIFIKSNELNSIFYVDEIFLIMSIPGYELLRLAITRIIKKKHPFNADNNHIHHLLLNVFGYKKTYFIIQCLLLLPYLVFLIIKNFYVSITISLLLYCILIFLQKNKIQNLK
jgi:UDP-GlcNAc:undecaprenyl-phosphate GlcNAc-1-phosphate transferase